MHVLCHSTVLPLYKLALLVVLIVSTELIEFKGPFSKTTIFIRIKECERINTYMYKKEENNFKNSEIIKGLLTKKRCNRFHNGAIRLITLIMHFR